MELERRGWLREITATRNHSPGICGGMSGFCKSVKIFLFPISHQTFIQVPRHLYKPYRYPQCSFWLLTTTPGNLLKFNMCRVWHFLTFSEHQSSIVARRTREYLRRAQFLNSLAVLGQGIIFHPQPPFACNMGINTIFSGYSGSDAGVTLWLACKSQGYFALLT